jgi:hypothetical protein
MTTSGWHAAFLSNFAELNASTNSVVTSRTAGTIVVLALLTLWSLMPKGPEYVDQSLAELAASCGINVNK